MTLVSCEAAANLPHAERAQASDERPLKLQVRWCLKDKSIDGWGGQPPSGFNSAVACRAGDVDGDGWCDVARVWFQPAFARAKREWYVEIRAGADGRLLRSQGPLPWVADGGELEVGGS